MPIVAMVRHGENEYVKKGRLAGRQPGVHLNNKGLEQARLLATCFKGAAVKAVYSSPLERTLETAQPIAEVLELDVIPREGLIETNYGEWQDQKLKGLSRTKLWKTVQHAPSIMKFPGGEAFVDGQVRIVRELIDLCTLHDPKDLFVCVSHADPIKLAVAYFIGLPLDMFQRLSVSPGSITWLGIGEMGGRLLSLNVEPEIGFPKL